MCEEVVGRVWLWGCFVVDVVVEGFCCCCVGFVILNEKKCLFMWKRGFCIFVDWRLYVFFFLLLLFFLVFFICCLCCCFLLFLCDFEGLWGLLWFLGFCVMFSGGLNFFFIEMSILCLCFFVLYVFGLGVFFFWL